MKKTKKQNSILKMIEVKKKISKAIKEGKDLSTLKGIKFVKPF